MRELIGAHPEALRDMYRMGRPTDTTALGGERDGYMLAYEPIAAIFSVTRPLVRALAETGLWRGKHFESGGTSGRDRMLGRRPFRFRCEVAPSALDGAPTLLMRYDNLGNPWPLGRYAGELRTLNDAVAIGPSVVKTGNGRHSVQGWWGLVLPTSP
ncbi:MAG: hypothetical protein AAGA56_09820 [Myxococcota bacterium]